MQCSKEAWDTFRQLYIEMKFFTHDEYFGIIADKLKLKPEDLTGVDSLINILASKDEQFNDIPLKKWDDRDGWVRERAAWHFPSWSLPDTVCVLKLVAKRYRDANKKTS